MHYPAVNYVIVIYVIGHRCRLAIYCYWYVSASCISYAAFTPAQLVAGNTQLVALV